MNLSFKPALALLLIGSIAAQGQFTGFANKGLVGVGRIAASTFDKAGDGKQDTLGGFSAMAIEPETLTYSGGSISGRLIGLPDRGFGDGTTDYRPRLEIYEFSIRPYYGTTAVGQDQITFTNTQTTLLTYPEGTNSLFFTGFDAGSTNQLTVPTSAAGSKGGGRRSMDPEGIALMPDGGFWISDEYGPGLYRFDRQANLISTVLPPPALLPYQGSYPGKLNFTGTSLPTSGRRNNRGLEGLSLTPDGKRLVAFLQSPTIQDGGSGNLGRNTRILQFDADTNSPTHGRLVAEHLYPLTLNGNATTNRHTPVSETLALNATTFLVLERDGIGRGADPGLSPTYKRIVVASTEGASNIAGTGHDLQLGAPGHQALNTAIKPVARYDLVDLLDPIQLARFGLNTSTNQDANALSEKWEALSLIPMKDPANPDDYLLLIGNDNDFKSEVVFHNGVPVGTNSATVDIMLLAYRVSLPGMQASRPANAAPLVQFATPSGTVFAQGPLPIEVSVSDADGIVTKAEYFDGAVRLGEKTAYPWVLNLPAPTVGLHQYRVVVTDNAGATAEVSKSVQVEASNRSPLVQLTAPTNGVSRTAPFNVDLTASTSDEDGFVVSVEYLAGTNRIALSTNAPFSAVWANAPIGTHTITAVSRDNLGQSTSSKPAEIRVNRAQSSALSLQILHASDFEAGVPAFDDAPGFSSVLNSLRAQFPTNTLVLSSGDNYIPGVFFNASADPAAPFNGVKGRGDIAILNALGIQVACFGNHEFDDNTPLVRSLILPDTAVGYLGTTFPYLSANLNFATDSSLASLVTADGQEASAIKNKIARSTVVTVAGQRIGIVGCTTPTLRTISSPGNIGILQDLVGTIQPAVDQLLASGINKVIVLAHLQQYAFEFELASQLRDVDVVIAGGNHAVFANPGNRLRFGDSAEQPYPVRRSTLTGEPVLVVSTAANYRYVGRLMVSFNEAGLVQSIDPKSGPYATDAQGVQDTGNAAPSAAVVSVITNLAAIVDGKDGNRFGRTAVYLNGLRNSVRSEESNLGNLTADANLFRARKTDPTTTISLKNGGGIRDSIGGYSSEGGSTSLIPPTANPRVGKQSGEVSQLDIENSLRFNNSLSLVTLTAQQVRDALEWAVAGSGTPGQFPQLSGLQMSFNPTNKPMTYLRNASGVATSIDFPGERLRNLVVVRPDDSLDLVVENGRLVGSPDRTFRMVTLNFLASGGDNYFALTQGKDRVDLAQAGTSMNFSTDGGEQWALAQYLAHIGVYSEQDQPIGSDLRLQNLSKREDSVLSPVLRSLEQSSTAGTQLKFRTLPGRRYGVEARDRLDGVWEKQQPEVLGDGTLRSFIDPRPGSEQRYYRVLVLP